MSWKKKEDLGTELVARVHDQLKVSDDWSIDSARGFTYWPCDLAVTVRADLPNFHNAYSIFRLHSEVDIVKANGKAGAMAERLGQMMSRAALSSVTYDEKQDTMKMHCSVYAHCDNAEWLARVFTAAVGLQIGMASSVSKHLQSHFKVPAATSGHPKAGFRAHADPIVNAIQQFFIPYGAVASKWDGSEEWEEAYRILKRLAHNVQFDGRARVTGEFDWIRNSPIEIEISASRPHLDLGNGLFFVLHVPWSESCEGIAATATELNQMERREWNWCHDLGSWCCVDDRLEFRCFVPNISFAPGVLTDLSHDMALRARWINDQGALKAMGVEMAVGEPQVL